MTRAFAGPSISPLFESSHPSRSRYAHQNLDNRSESKEFKFIIRFENDFSRETADPHSSMASSQRRGAYDMSTNRLNDEYQRRQSLTQSTSREQLPPLSSIFQTSHTTTLPVRTTYPERSPSSTAVSPRTNVQPFTGPVREDRHHQDQSYDRRNYAQVSLPAYNFSVQSGRPEIPHPSRTLSSGSLSGPGVPQSFGSHYSNSEKSRASSTTRLGWSPRAPGSPNSEYLPRISQNGDEVYSTSRQQLPPAPPTTRYTNPEPLYRNRGSITSPPVTQYHVTSSATNHPEPTSTKDSLGPKIWTGTQFLPRFVKQQEVPGEGICYFYDDGSHCKNIIDGEVVNAHWGVTKAGKPRKRLAIACITCREKKIKCDPDFPKCLQCQKFGRVCKFKNAPRGASHGSPDASPTETEDFMDHDSQRAEAEALRLEKDDADNNLIKRRKNTLNAFTPVKSEHEAHFGTTDQFRHLSSASENSLYCDNLMHTWYTNPYESSPAFANHLMMAYFAHVNSGYCCMFPEQQFMNWLRNPSKKSLDDHMLIYTMLALGTVFSGSAEHKERGREFARIGRYAAEHRSFSLQLVQSRLLLSLYYFATGDNDASWDFCGGAMRAATGFKLNVEIDQVEEMKTETFAFDLNRHCYSECRRRTFWSLYIMDRFNGISFGYLCAMNPEDVFLRLPCSTRSFEAQLENTNPYFDISAASITSAKLNNLGSMAYLIIMSSIWSDVMANIYRISNRPEQLSTISKAAHLNFHHVTTKRLEEWEASLPSDLQYSAANLDRSMHEGYFGTFLTMHALYHTTQIKLNRFHRPADVSSSQLERNIRKAYTSSRTLLTIAKILAESTTIRQQPQIKPIELLVTKTQLSNQFLTYALLSAADIVSAKGKRSEIPELLEALDEAKRVLNQLEMFWHSARNASRLVEKRIYELEEVIGQNSERQRCEGVISGVTVNQEIWKMDESLDSTLGKGMDGVYGQVTWEIWESATQSCKTEN